MKKHNFSADIKTWLDFAEYDLKSAKWTFKGKIYTSVCYACQQSAEKALKAFVLAKGGKIPKVHSLDHLLSDLKKLNVNVSSIEKYCQELDKYYITARYPGQYGGPEGLYDRANAKAALFASEKILEYVRVKTLVKNSISPPF